MDLVSKETATLGTHGRVEKIEPQPTPPAPLPLQTPPPEAPEVEVFTSVLVDTVTHST